jgi:predicted AlkP superfamily pyrophosphatase or phosphodiesterase
MRKSRVIVVTVFLFVSLITSSAQDPVKIPSEKPALIIGIVIDQMRYDYIYRFWDKYSDGGFKRMVKGGTLCKNANYNFLINETAVGYATISTGALPSHHGIISNSWYVSLQDEIIDCVGDDKVNTVGGSYEAGKSSPRKLLASTIGDELKLANNFKTKVIGIALDDHAAILSAGHAADYAFWYDGETGNWVTSSYYVDSLPDWVVKFNEVKLADVYLSRTWETLLPLEEYTESVSDTNKLETGLNGRYVFPYDLKKLSSPRRNETDYDIIKYTPFGNVYTKDLAIAAMISEKLGKDEYTDFLTIGFSVNEYVGKAFGSNSVEMEDVLLRLDRELEHFFNFIDEFVGKEKTLIYLTADHGLAYHPAYLKEHRIPSGEFNPNAAISLLSSYLNIIYGQGDWVKYYYAQQLYLNHELIEDARIPLAEFQNKVVLFLLQFEGVSNAVSSHTLQTTNFSDGIFRNIQNGFHQKRSGDVIINLAPGWTEKDFNNSSYHSSYVGDNHVPLLWYGWKIKRVTINRPVSLVDIVPTLAYFLNISTPNAATGEIILELVE